MTAVDARARAGDARAPDRQVDWVRCSRPFTGGYLDDARVALEAIWSEAEDAATAHGEFIGLVKATAEGAAVIRAALDSLATEGALDGADLPDLFARLMARGVVIDVLYVTGHWLDVDDAFDLASLRNLV